MKEQKHIYFTSGNDLAFVMKFIFSSQFDIMFSRNLPFSIFCWFGLIFHSPSVPCMWIISRNLCAKNSIFLLNCLFQPLDNTDKHQIVKFFLASIYFTTFQHHRIRISVNQTKKYCNDWNFKIRNDENKKHFSNPLDSRVSWVNSFISLLACLYNFINLNSWYLDNNSPWHDKPPKPIQSRQFAELCFFSSFFGSKNST